MAEYIDRHALKNDGHLCWHDGKGNTYYEVDHAPTADVMEVVRCKDCKQWRRNIGFADSPNGHCFYNDIDTNGFDFCSYGERRDI